jgi:hypothetical protein
VARYVTRALFHYVGIRLDSPAITSSAAICRSRVAADAISQKLTRPDGEIRASRVDRRRGSGGVGADQGCVNPDLSRACSPIGVRTHEKVQADLERGAPRVAPSPAARDASRRSYSGISSVPANSVPFQRPVAEKMRVAQFNKPCGYRRSVEIRHGISQGSGSEMTTSQVPSGSHRGLTKLRAASRARSTERWVVS